MTDEERHLHIDMDVWIDRYLQTTEGRDLRLTEFQLHIVDAVARGERVVLISPRRPDRAAVMSAVRGALALAGVEALEVSSLPTRPHLAGDRV